MNKTPEGPSVCQNCPTIKISTQEAQLRSLNPLPSICGSANVEAGIIYHYDETGLRYSVRQIQFTDSSPAIMTHAVISIIDFEKEKFLRGCVNQITKLV